MLTRNDKARIDAALADLGVSQIAYLPVEKTEITAVRVTDQPYRDHDVAKILAEVINTIVPVTSVASNALYGDDEQTLGAVIFVRAF